jgi:hypothetical protein
MALSTEAPTTATGGSRAAGPAIISADCHAGGSHAQCRERFSIRGRNKR